MMRTCDLCGMGDDIYNMYYATDPETHSIKCICEYCVQKQKYDDVSPVTDIIDTAIPVRDIGNALGHDDL